MRTGGFTRKKRSLVDVEFDKDDEGNVSEEEFEYASRSWEDRELKSSDGQVVRRKLPVKTELGAVIKGAFEKVQAKSAAELSDGAIRKEQKSEDNEENLSGTDKKKQKKKQKKLEKELRSAQAPEETAVFDHDDDELEDEEEEEKAFKEKESSGREKAEPKVEEEPIDEEAAKITIASLCNSILANESNSVKAVGVKTTSSGVVVPPEPTAMEQLLSLCRSNASGWNVRKLAIISLLAVFKDVLPDEKIRDLTEVEVKAKVSKDVRQQRGHEKALLNAYRLYLAILLDGVKAAPWESRTRKGQKERAAMTEKIRKTKAKTGRLCIYCMCDLMEARPNFNFYEEILKMVVPRTSSPDPKTSRICSEGLAKAIEDDSSYQCALTVIRSLGKLYEKRHSVSAKAVEAFFNIKFTLDMKDEKQMQQLDKARKERVKKRRKLGMDVAKAIEEADIVQTRKHEMLQRQLEVIRELFTLYLRILTDAAQEETLLTRPLTSQALKGAGKLVQLMNIEFVHGVVKILSLFFNDKDTPIREVGIALQTCETGLTAMSILSRPELRTKSTASEEIHFTKLLLRCVAQLTANENSALHINAVIRCVSTLFFKRRETDHRVVADFCVRLLNAALRVPSHFALGLLAIQRNLLERYPSAKELVLGAGASVEEQPCGPLIPVAFSADTVGSEARAGWELDLLARSHYHVGVRKYANDVRSLSKAAYNDRPLELMSLHHPLDGELFFPGVSPSFSASMGKQRGGSKGTIVGAAAAVASNSAASSAKKKDQKQSSQPRGAPQRTGKGR